MNEWKIDKELGKGVYGRVENYTDEEKQILWDKIKNELQEYEPFIGTIFVKAPFGVFLDIGKEFPALLKVTDMKRLKDKNSPDYWDGEIYVLGEKLDVYFIYMHDDPDKILVTEDIENHKYWAMKFNER